MESAADSKIRTQKNKSRFYGKSLPFGAKKSFTQPIVGLLTSEQALADYATLITHIKQQLNATAAPVIAFGGSYGGMLSAWFRIKYPNVVDGALAASAPLLGTVGAVPRTYFFQDVTKDFESVDPACRSRVQESFSRLLSLAQEGDTGLSKISKLFQLCDPLRNMADFTHLLGWIRNSFTYLAMLDYPYKVNFLGHTLPAYPVRAACKVIQETSDLLSGFAKASGMYYGPMKCRDIFKEFVSCSDPTGCGLGPDSLAWDYQACTEQIMPAGTDNVTDMFPVLPFTLEDRDDYCLKTWKVKPRNSWMLINFWGKDIKHTSNIIFSNGDLDPWHRGGILENISDSLVAIRIAEGAHHLDLRASNPDDPPSVVKARQQETDIISGWLKEANRNYLHQP